MVGKQYFDSTILCTTDHLIREYVDKKIIVRNAAVISVSRLSGSFPFVFTFSLAYYS